MGTVSSRVSSAAAPQYLDPLLLASTLCARLCHDLAGSLGALTGTLEIAVEEHDHEALELSLALSHDLAARLRLLRAAWGPASDLPPLETLLAGLPGADKLRVELSAFAAADDGVRRLALMFLLVAAAGLPRGGAIRLQGGATALRLEIEGQGAHWPEALESCLAGEAAMLEACDAPRDVAVPLACLHARALGLRIEVLNPTQLSVG